MPAPRILLLALCSVALACAGEAPADSAVEVIDSAGVRIVMNAAPDTADPAFRISAEPLATIGVTEGPPEYQLFRVASGRRLSDGTIVIANGGTLELRFYDATGAYIRSVGREGEGPGEFKSISVVGVLADDSLLVNDNNQRRYSIFDRAGTFVRSFQLPDALPAFGMTTAGVLADGRIVVRQEGFFPQGPQDLAQDGIVRRPDVISTINPDGSFGARIGEAPGMEMSWKSSGPMGPTNMGVVFGRSAHAAAGGDRIVIATNDAYNLPVHDGDGRLVQIVRQERVPTPVREGDFERSIPPVMRADAPASPMKDRFAPHFETMPRHTTLPAFGSGGPGSAIRLDADGTLWVAEYEPEFGGSRSSWQAFDRDGVYLGRLELPEGFVVFEFGRDWVLGRLNDEMEVERVMLYELERVAPPQ